MLLLHTSNTKSQKTMKHLKITVRGKVQGVFYRKNALEQAQKYNIKGFVQNQTDGSVYAEAEGDDTALNAFTNWCKTGSKAAKVERVETETGEFKDYREFSIKR